MQQQQQPASAETASAAKCPIDHTKLSREQWEQMAAAHRQPQPSAAALTAAASATTASSTTSTAPSQPSSPSTFISAASQLACDSSTIANAPSAVNDAFPDADAKSPNQRLPLSSLPIVSNIPRAGVDPATGKEFNAWVYPSPQRFYNAMDRKGWSPKEKDMPHVVSIHNTVNERTWRLVSEWEAMHKDSCPTPKLARFKGRPNDLSPKARFMSTFMGYTPPFDRHDWYVDRCGTEVRYVIDFYPGQASLDAAMGPAIHLDTRPALDSLGAFLDRMRKTWSEWRSSSSATALSTNTHSSTSNTHSK